MSLRLVTLLSVLLAFATPALAQVEDVEMPPSEMAARGHYLMGQEHYRAARFAEAAQEFQRAYDLSHRPRLLFNSFMAHRDAGQPREAAEALRAYIAAAPDDPQLEVLRGRLATLEAQVAAEDERAAARAVPVDSTAVEGGTDVVAADPATSPGGQVEGGADAGPWIVIGVGGAMAIGAIVTGIVTATTYGELSSSCTDGVCPPDADLQGRRSTGSALAVTSDVLGGVAAATMIGGIVWAIVDATSRPGTTEAATLACTPLGCRGRF